MNPRSPLSLEEDSGCVVRKKSTVNLQDSIFTYTETPHTPVGTEQNEGTKGLKIACKSGVVPEECLTNVASVKSGPSVRSALPLPE